MPLGAHVVEDYRRLSLSLKAHPVAFMRRRLEARGILRSEDLAEIASGKRVTVAGLVLVRQRPGTASGVIFMTIEDETGIANIIVWPKVFERLRPIVIGARFVAVTGKLQSQDSVIHLIAERMEDLTPMLGLLSERGPQIDVIGPADEARRPPPAGGDRRGGRTPRASPVMRRRPPRRRSSSKSAILSAPCRAGGTSIERSASRAASGRLSAVLPPAAHPPAAFSPIPASAAFAGFRAAPSRRARRDRRSRAGGRRHRRNARHRFRAARNRTSRRNGARLRAASALVAPIARRSRIRREHVAVTRDGAIEIDDGQRKTGALQQGAQNPHIGERRDARRGAGQNFAFRRGQALAQFVQAFAAHQAAEKQAVWPQGAANLDQRARQIIDALERQKRYDRDRSLHRRAASALHRRRCVHSRPRLRRDYVGAARTTKPIRRSPASISAA